MMYYKCSIKSCSYDAHGVLPNGWFKSDVVTLCFFHSEHIFFWKRMQSHTMLEYFQNAVSAIFKG